MNAATVLALRCKDQPGLVTHFTQLVFNAGGNIREAHQFNARDTGSFFMRLVFESPDGVALATEEIEKQLDDMPDDLHLSWRLVEEGRRKKVLMLVSKQDHCLGDLLYRMRIGELRMEVVGIISNHPKASLHLTTFGDIPYHHLPVTPETKVEQETRIRAIVDQTGAELVVLARYMQVLSGELCDFLSGRCVNIHHSFLPGFKGAKPYHQAYDRGVKMIGATAHFVTRDLDEGPIIVQDVEAISHADTIETLIRKGRNIEQRVLSTAVTAFLEDRVFLDGHRAVVF
ncbi:MAG: formyltetrahydrofolate deformylase [Pseudomonadales bacterium]